MKKRKLSGLFMALITLLTLVLVFSIAASAVTVTEQITGDDVNLPDGTTITRPAYNLSTSSGSFTTSNLGWESKLGLNISQWVIDPGYAIKTTGTLSGKNITVAGNKITLNADSKPAGKDGIYIEFKDYLVKCQHLNATGTFTLKDNSFVFSDSASVNLVGAVCRNPFNIFGDIEVEGTPTYDVNTTDVTASFEDLLIDSNSVTANIVSSNPAGSNYYGGDFKFTTTILTEDNAKTTHLDYFKVKGNFTYSNNLASVTVKDTHRGGYITSMASVMDLGSATLNDFTVGGNLIFKNNKASATVTEKLTGGPTIQVQARAWNAGSMDNAVIGGDLVIEGNEAAIAAPVPTGDKAGGTYNSYTGTNSKVLALTVKGETIIKDNKASVTFTSAGTAGTLGTATAQVGMYVSGVEEKYLDGLVPNIIFKDKVTSTGNTCEVTVPDGTTSNSPITNNICLGSFVGTFGTSQNVIFEDDVICSGNKAIINGEEISAFDTASGALKVICYAIKLSNADMEFYKSVKLLDKCDGLSVTSRKTIGSKGSYEYLPSSLTWNLTGGVASHACIENYQYVIVDEYSKQYMYIKVAADQERGQYVIATGDFTDLTNKDTFTIKTASDGTGVSITVNGSKVTYNNVDYKLTIDDNGTPADATDDKLVLTIGKTLTVSGTSAADKTYDGFTGATVTVGQINGIANGDNVIVTATGTFDSADVANSKNVAVHYTLSGSDKDKYFITDETVVADITKRDVTLTSASDAKIYDGAPLTNSNVSVTGSGWVGDEGAAYTVTGSQTQVGTSSNPFTYTLNDGTKAANYDITTVEGTLTVTQRDVTLKSADLTKEYDGTNLLGGGDVNDLTAGLTDKGYVSGEEFSYSFTGSQLFVGSSDNIFTVADSLTANLSSYNITQQYGTLTVTGRTAPLTITVADQEKMYDGTANFDTTAYTLTGELAYGDTITITLSNTNIDAGTYTDGIIATYKIMHGDTDVTMMYVNVTVDNGDLTVNKRQVTFTSADDEMVYYGGELTNSEVTLTGDGFIAGEGATYSVTGTQTDVGTSKNKFTYTLKNGTKAANYDITVVYGTLEVTPRYVTIKAEGATKVYDGTPLTNDKLTISGHGFAEGEGATYEITGSQTEVGSSPNRFTYTLNAGTKATNYIITLIKSPLVVTTGGSMYVYGTSYEGVYDGQAHGEAATASVTAGTKLTYSTDGGKTWSADVPTIKNVGTLNVTVKAENANYDRVSTATYTLTVTQRNVTLTSATDTKAYDGTALTNDAVTADGFAEGEGATYSVTGTQTEAGSSKNTFTYTLNENTDAANYSITVVEGTLTVEAAAPEIIEGANQEIDLTKGTAASFRSNASIKDFIKVVVDGKDVDSANYEVKEGSTIVTLKPEFLATLGNGEHTLSIVSATGTASTTFTLSGKSEETTAPAEETTAPAAETTAPAEETTAPAAETTAPAETAAPETAPVETKPVETAPVETKPAETTPVETKKPVETEKPVESTGVATESGAAHDNPPTGDSTTAPTLFIALAIVALLAGTGITIGLKKKEN